MLIAPDADLLRYMAVVVVQKHHDREGSASASDLLNEAPDPPQEDIGCHPPRRRAIVPCFLEPEPVAVVWCNSGLQLHQDEGWECLPISRDTAQDCHLCKKF